MRKLRVFIAGSKSLKKEREMIRVVASQVQSRQGIIIDIKSYEDFNEEFTPAGAQKDHYNRYIVSESDLIIFILDGNIGGITKKEFLIAYESYKKIKRPRICVYVKQHENQEENKDIQEVRELISLSSQYYTDYTDNIDLERKIEAKFMREVVDGLKAQWTTSKLIIKCLLPIVLIVGCGYLFSEFKIGDKLLSSVTSFIEQKEEREYPLKSPNPPQSLLTQNVDLKEFDIVKPFSEGMACVRKGSKWGFVNKNNDVVVPIIFDDVFAFHEGLAQVKYNNKWGFVNNRGIIVVSPKYESVSKFVGGFACVEQNGKFGFINQDGEFITKIIYDDVWAFEKGKARVWQNKKSFFINTKGERVE